MSQEAIPPRNQVAEYEAAAPKTIVELQQFRQTSSSPYQIGQGRRRNGYTHQSQSDNQRVVSA